MRKLALLALLLACKSAPEVKSPPVGAAETTPSAAPSATKVAEAQAPAPGIDLSIIDRSVNPCDDFYRFSCGKWLERTPIPPDRPLWGRAF
jgi:hypothetical protein